MNFITALLEVSQYTCSSQTGVTVFVLGSAFLCPNKDEVVHT